MANQLPTGRVVQEQGNGQLPGTFATLQPDNSAIIGMLKTRAVSYTHLTLPTIYSV